ncbi:MAG: ATP-dependent DNA helicase RecQ [Sphingobacteriaceae bacterium]
MTIQQVLKQYWGYDAFRPSQEDIIQSVLEGHDTLALLPTGGGKSICFQVPAMVQEGICIVVSPLIALMKDQVENLKARGIDAMAIVSGMGKREIDILLDNCIYGNVKFLYISPERLLSPLAKERIRHMKVNLFAIDESHCISQWGYDFRPPYLHLAALRDLHPKVPFLALTATATDRVAEDICTKLAFRKNHQVFRKSFERSNLSYVVAKEENKFRRLMRVVNQVKGSGIIYVRNRRETQEVARHLQVQGIGAAFYHAGLSAEERTKRQDDWKTGKVPLIVATNAFGMGIDKPDVRYVVHLDLPDSLEAYYQEAGRAGRDERKAYAVLLYNEADILLLEQKLAQSSPTLKEIQQVYHHFGNYFQLAYGAGEGVILDFDLADFCKRYKLEAIKTLNALKILEREEYIALSETVYLPSRLKILVDHDTLYKFQVAQPTYDALIKTMLRSYGGLYEHYAPIKESELAKRADISRNEVKRMLENMQSMELLSYIPQTDQPQITFLRPRVDREHLGIDHQHLAERYRINQHQVAAVIQYVRSQKCRSQQLLAYFDELNAPACGVCDFCLSQKKSTLHQHTENEIREEMISLLSKKQLKLEELIPQLKLGNEEQRLAQFRELLDAGEIKTEGEHFFI